MNYPFIVLTVFGAHPHSIDAAAFSRAILIGEGETTAVRLVQIQRLMAGWG